MQCLGLPPAISPGSSLNSVVGITIPDFFFLLNIFFLSELNFWKKKGTTLLDLSFHPQVKNLSEILISNFSAIKLAAKPYEPPCWKI